MYSAHYFDVLQNVVAQGWYEQGMRLLDVTDPADIRQIGYLIPPDGVSWAAYFAPTDPDGRVLYMLDASLGLIVLEYDRPTQGSLAMPAPPAPPVEEEEEEEPGTNQGGDGTTQSQGNQGSGSNGEASEPPASVSNDGSGSTSVTPASSEKKPCKAKRTKKARRACRKRRVGGGGTTTPAPSNASYEPTVVAPIKAEWMTGTPASAPSRQFGYACRILL